jgi:8-amino-7-oxononanoate synthase
MTAPQILRFEKELNDKKENNLFRKIPDTNRDDIINLATNSYLNLEEKLEVINNAKELTKKFSGNLASRVVAVNSPLFTALENELASWKNAESALIFNSGYSANCGIIQAVANRNSVVFSDKLNHASIVDGILLSRAKHVRYPHCDTCFLRKELAKYPNKEKLIITDAIFSMDGNQAPLVELAKLAEEFNALFMVDEAHSTGVFGDNSTGLVEQLGLEERIHIRMGTFSKALAGFGGFFVGSKTIRNYLINSARSFIFSTALPETVLAHNLAAVKFVRKNPNLGSILQKEALFLREELEKMGFNCGDSNSQIIPIITGSEQSALNLSAKLKNKNIIAPAIRPPTVPVGTSRVRLSLHSGISHAQILDIISIFEEIIK